MTERPDDSKRVEIIIEMIGHISIRDPDTGEVILRQRDQIFEKATDDHDDR